MENSHDSFFLSQQLKVCHGTWGSWLTKYINTSQKEASHFDQLTRHWFHIDQDVNKENVNGFALWLWVVIFHMLSGK